MPVTVWIIIGVVCFVFRGLFLILLLLFLSFFIGDSLFYSSSGFFIFFNSCSPVFFSVTVRSFPDLGHWSTLEKKY